MILNFEIFLNCQILESLLFNSFLDVQDLTFILSDSDLKIIKITNYRKIKYKIKKMADANKQ